MYEQAKNLVSVPGISHGFFNRLGGVSSKPFEMLNCSLKVGDEPHLVRENRLRALAALDLTDRLLMIPDLAHSTKVLTLHESDTPEIIAHLSADAVITSSSRHALGVTYADCLPVALALEDGSYIAMIHAGWRGILGDIIGETVRELIKLTTAQTIYAAIGPALSPRGFSFAGEGLKAFTADWPDFVQHDNHTSFVDLCGVAKAQLSRAGVVNIEKVGGYTDTSSDYFSHRRDHGQTGRHLAIIARGVSFN